jgi:hypothetical protein
LRSRELLRYHLWVLIDVPCWIYVGESAWVVHGFGTGELFEEKTSTRSYIDDVMPSGVACYAAIASY